jgi:hypothetical protein
MFFQNSRKRLREVWPGPGGESAAELALVKQWQGGANFNCGRKGKHQLQLPSSPWWDAHSKKRGGAKLFRNSWGKMCLLYQKHSDRLENLMPRNKNCELFDSWNICNCVCYLWSDSSMNIFDCCFLLSRFWLLILSYVCLDNIYFFNLTCSLVNKSRDAQLS